MDHQRSPDRVVHSTTVAGLQRLPGGATISGVNEARRSVTEHSTNPEHKLGAYVQRLRTDAGLTLGQLERRSGVNKSTLMRIENGQRPTSSTLNKLARGLGIDPEVLYDAAWDETEALPSAAVYFRSKYRLTPEQIAQLQATAEAMAKEQVNEDQITKGGHHDGKENI